MRILHCLSPCLRQPSAPRPSIRRQVSEPLPPEGGLPIGESWPVCRPASRRCCHSLRHASLTTGRAMGWTWPHAGGKGRRGPPRAACERARLFAEDVFHRLALGEFVDQFVEVADLAHHRLLNLLHADAAYGAGDQKARRVHPRRVR